MIIFDQYKLTGFVLIIGGIDKVVLILYLFKEKNDIILIEGYLDS